MGWAWAPWCAQTVTTAIVAPADPGRHCNVIYDDVAILAHSRHGLARRRSAVLQRQQRVGVKMNARKSDLRDLQHFTHAGIEYNLALSGFRLPAEFRTKAIELVTLIVQLGTVTMRALWQSFGLLMWGFAATLRPLYHISEILMSMSELSRKVSGASDWESMVKIPRSLRASMMHAVNMVLRPCDWLPAPPSHVPAALCDVASSDAAGGREGGWGWIVHGRSLGRDTLCWGTYDNPCLHIYFREFEALLRLVRWWVRKSGQSSAGLLCRVDNSAVVGSVRRGHSSTRRGNELLAELFSLIPRERIRVEFVPTTKQLADFLTRIPPERQSAWPRAGAPFEAWMLPAYARQEYSRQRTIISRIVHN
jgi:hypothetical protein